MKREDKKCHRVRLEGGRVRETHGRRANVRTNRADTMRPLPFPSLGIRARPHVNATNLLLHNDAIEKVSVASRCSTHVFFLFF